MDASTSSHSPTFYDFLDRMRNPASLNLVRSIKSFIVSFSFYPPNPENDGKKVQDFYLTMEAAIREHPLWTDATEEEIDCAMEGLEKYIMTKLFSRTFAVSPEDAKTDHEVSEKICLLQTFLKPEHLDIPAVLRNEASWLLAEKELQKINTFKAPREKLTTIMNCCRVINNLLLNAAMSENHVPAGADDFLPVLIYVTIKAGQSSSVAIKPQIHPAVPKEFIVDLNATSLSMDEIKFEESMQAAKLISKVAVEFESSLATQMSQTNQPDETECSHSKKMYGKFEDSPGMPLQGSKYPYLDAKSGDLTVRDVDRLLNIYKDVVAKYTTLCTAISHLSTSEREPLYRHLGIRDVPINKNEYKDGAKEDDNN